jgi:hypothetical protein
MTEPAPRSIADEFMERDLEARGMSELLRLLRREGWRVAVHNDYEQNGQLFTFWLLTYGSWCVKGEAATDYEALRICRAEIDKLKAICGEKREKSDY